MKEKQKNKLKQRDFVNKGISFIIAQCHKNARPSQT